MLSTFGDRIWVVNGPIITAAAGFHYPTRMAIMQLNAGGLVIWSPTELTNDLEQHIRALGPVVHIIAPNTLHHMYAAQWCDAFPQAALHGAPGLVEKRADLTFATTLTNTAHPDWEGQIDQVVIGGNAITTEVVFFHVSSQTTLFTDLLQQMPKTWFSGWRRIIAQLDGMTGPEPAVPRKFRIAFRDKTEARRAITKVLTWPTHNVLMAHGTPILHDGHAFLRRAFSWLLK